MSTNPNTIKSQHELTNEGGRKSDVLLSTIEELEKTKLQLDIAIIGLTLFSEIEDWEEEDKFIDCVANIAEEYLKQIQELNK